MKQFFVWLILPAWLSSCAPATGTWDRISAAPTLETLRAFVHEHPDTEEARIARLHMEQLSAKEALASNSIFRLSMHMQAFPGGSREAEVQGALIRLRVERARQAGTPWAFLRFLFLHPDTPEAEEITGLLEDVWWDELQKKPSPRQLKAYLERFPKGKHQQSATELLADTVFERLGTEPAPDVLRLFVMNYPESRRGKEAARKLREYEQMEILFTGNVYIILDQMGKGEVQQGPLLQAVMQAHLESALWEMDLDRLGAICHGMPGICVHQLPEAIETWRKLPAARLETLVSTVHGAGPFRPFPALNTLEIALNVEDPHTVWVAMNSLSYRPEPRAFFILLSRVGHADPTYSLAATEACVRWFSHWPERGSLLAEHALILRRNLAERPEILFQIALLSKLLNRPVPVEAIRKMVPAEPYTLSLLVLQAQTTGVPPWNNLVHEATNSLNRMRDHFPKVVEKDTFPLARQFARRLYRFHGLLTRLPPVPPPFDAAISSLVNSARTLLASWEAQLEAFPEYIPSDRDPLVSQIREFEQKRLQYMEKLHKFPEPFGGNWWKTRAMQVAPFPDLSRSQ